MRLVTSTITLLMLLAWTGAASGAVRRMFVTSVSGTGDLGSWPDAGAESGVAAGDRICQVGALAGGLPNPTTYVAWLSDDVTDAYCHLHGLTGKKAFNCGQPTLPAAAGPWLRAGGNTPFAPDVTHLLAPYLEAILPPRLDENANTVHANIWTGTDIAGTHTPSQNCLLWTVSQSAFDGVIGRSDDVGRAWTDVGAATCNSTQHLLCLEPGVGDPLAPTANWGRLAFVTSAVGSGDLGSWAQAGGQTGLAAGNAICRNLAIAAGLANASSFKAWLSSGSADARDRFTYDGPWMRLDRERLAANLAGLTDGYLNTALLLDETGSLVTGDFANSLDVWTGTAPDGTADTPRCNNWTSGSMADDSLVGLSYAADGSWTWSSFAETCDSPLHLYCLQDLPLVFGDGFESGNTAVWSVAFP